MFPPGWILSGYAVGRTSKKPWTSAMHHAVKEPSACPTRCWPQPPNPYAEADWCLNGAWINLNQNKSVTWCLPAIIETISRRPFQALRLSHKRLLTRNHAYCSITKCQLSHKDAFTRRCLYTQRRFYTQTLLHTALLHRETFTHRCLYTQMPQAPLHTDAFTHACHTKRHVMWCHIQTREILRQNATKNEILTMYCACHRICASSPINAAVPMQFAKLKTHRRTSKSTAPAPENENNPKKTVQRSLPHTPECHEVPCMPHKTTCFVFVKMTAVDRFCSIRYRHSMAQSYHSHCVHLRAVEDGCQRQSKVKRTHLHPQPPLTNESPSLRIWEHLHPSINIHLYIVLPCLTRFA